MLSVLSNFYFSRLLGKKVFTASGEPFGTLRDLCVDVSFVRPKVVCAVVRAHGAERCIDFETISIAKKNGQYSFHCGEIADFDMPTNNIMSLRRNILDRQLVDIDGRKLVRVNDLKLAILSSGVYVIAVDVGVEGLLRRLGIAKPLNKLLKPFKTSLPGQLILWDEVATVDYGNAGIQLSKKYSKLSSLHPSDIADIIEELDLNSRIDILTSLDESQAADVFEEIETDVQISVLQNLPAEKAADMLELMPVDEVADILDELEKEKAEELLGVMDKETSDEVREIMRYPENTTGSFMSTDFISFGADVTVEEAISELRQLKPEADVIYYLYVLDGEGRLSATVSLRDIIVSMPEVRLRDIMEDDLIFVYDDEKINSVADIISKYNLLAPARRRPGDENGRHHRY